MGAVAGISTIGTYAYFSQEKFSDGLLADIDITYDIPTSSTGWFLEQPTANINLGEGVPSVKYAITNSKNIPADSEFKTVTSTTLGYQKQYRYRYIQTDYTWDRILPQTVDGYSWVPTGNTQQKNEWKLDYFAATHLSANDIDVPIDQKFYVDSKGNKVVITDIDEINTNTTVYEYGISGFFYDKPLIYPSGCYVPTIDLYGTSSVPQPICNGTPATIDGDLKGDNSFYQIGPSKLQGTNPTWKHYNGYEYPFIFSEGYENKLLFQGINVPDVPANPYINSEKHASLNGAKLMGIDFDKAIYKNKPYTLREYKLVRDSGYLFTTNYGISITYPSNTSDSEWTEVIKEFKIPISGEGTFYIHIKQDDGLNHTKTTTSEPINIDKTKPTLSSQTNIQGNITYSTNDAISGIREIRLPNNTITTVQSGYFLAGTDGVYNFEIKDNAGNATSVDVVISKDVSPPKVSHALIPDTWTNQDVIIRITGTDESGINNIKDPNNTSHNASTLDFSVKSNGVYTFVVTDNAGNATPYNVSVDIIDKTEPVAKITTSTDVCTREDVNLTFVAEDYQSGISNIQFQLNTDIWKPATNGQRLTITSEGTFNYKLKATDIAGNILTTPVTTIKIDKTPPSASHTITTEAKTATIKVTATDKHCGVKEIKLPNGIKILGDNTSYQVSANGDYKFTIIDTAGNSTDYIVTIDSFDNEAPDLKLNVPNIDEWTREKTITATATDKNGIAWIKLPNGGLVYSNQATYTVNENDYYYFTTQDNNGNETKSYIYVGKIDRTIPQAEINNPSNGNWTNQSVGVTVTGGN